MELRAQKPLEKIKVKELCDLACINKSTFYAHYQDIYALANAMEDEMVEVVVESLPPAISSCIRFSHFCWNRKSPLARAMACPSIFT